MASSEFVWFLGDDDLLVPSAINQLKKILKKIVMLILFGSTRAILIYPILENSKALLIPINCHENEISLKQQK